MQFFFTEVRKAHWSSAHLGSLQGHLVRTEVEYPITIALLEIRENTHKGTATYWPQYNHTLQSRVESLVDFVTFG